MPLSAVHRSFPPAIFSVLLKIRIHADFELRSFFCEKTPPKAFITPSSMTALGDSSDCHPRSYCWRIASRFSLTSGLFGFILNAASKSAMARSKSRFSAYA